MGFVWEHQHRCGKNLRVLVVDTDGGHGGSLEKPNRTVFCPDVCRKVILQARTPAGIDKATALLKKHGLSRRESEGLLRDMAPYYRSFRR